MMPEPCPRVSAAGSCRTRTIPVLVACILLIAPPAAAQGMESVFGAQQEAVENPGGGIKVVTPLKDCLDKLPPEEAAAVVRNYMKPYQECHMRLQAQARHGQAAAEKTATPTAGYTAKEDEKTAAEAQEPAAESPRNFVRVRRDSSPRRAANYADIENTAPQGIHPPAPRNETYNR